MHTYTQNGKVRPQRAARKNKKQTNKQTKETKKAAGPVLLVKANPSYSKVMMYFNILITQKRRAALRTASGRNMRKRKPSSGRR